MRYSFSRRDPRSLSRDRRFAEIRALYHRLLLMAAGDVEQALRWLERIGERYGLFDEEFTLRDFLERLQEEGAVEQDPRGRLRMGPGGESALRRDALERVFSSLAAGAAGDHRTVGTGAGLERLAETRSFSFGDEPSAIDFRTSIQNAVRRSGFDFDLREEDLEVFETEALCSCATVIAIDVSHSMTLYGEDRITPAKQVSLALVELIRTRFPQDHVSVVLFGDTAVEVPIHRIPYVSNGPYHTNTREGLRLAAEILLRRRQPNKQIFMVTDGKPSAITTEDGSIYKNPFGLDEMVVNRTVEEAVRLRRRGIVVTTFMLTDDPSLVAFVDTLTRENRGRAYYAGAGQLGSFVLVDYIRNRRRAV